MNLSDRHYARLLAAALIALSTSAFATPESTAALVTEVRPYISGATFVSIDNSSLCGTTVFSIAADAPGKKERYAAVLTALSTGKYVRLEAANATGCVGWGTQLQSVYLQAN